jgi:antibiotic biosynthesis monooxygenase (ABM) superfamily enzyme
VHRRIRAGLEKEFEAWLGGVTRASSSLPGHEGTVVLRPTPREVMLVFRYATQAHLDAWTSSPSRAEWIAKGDELTDGPAIVQAQSGLETWFTLPGQPAQTPPPRWKMALVTWLALSPVILVISALFGPLLSAWPEVPRVFASAGLSVLMMTWMVMPLATRALWKWLYPKRA